MIYGGESSIGLTATEHNQILLLDGPLHLLQGFCRAGRGNFAMTWCVPVETCGIYADANTPFLWYLSMVGNVFELMTQLYLSWTTIL